MVVKAKNALSILKMNIHHNFQLDKNGWPTYPDVSFFVMHSPKSKNWSVSMVSMLKKMNGTFLCGIPIVNEWLIEESEFSDMRVAAEYFVLKNKLQKTAKLLDKHFIFHPNGEGHTWFLLSITNK